MDYTLISLKTVQGCIINSFRQCFLDISSSIFLYKHYNINYQMSSTTIYSVMTTTSTFKGQELEISIRLTVSGILAIFQFYSILSIYLIRLFPNDNRFSRFLNRLYTKKFDEPIPIVSVIFPIRIDMSILPTHNPNYKLIKYYKLTNLYEYCPIIKLSCLEIANDIGIIKSKNGFIILVLNTKIPKIANLRCYNVPTELEFEILLDIALENISRNAFEDLMFNSLEAYSGQIPYISGLKNLGNTCYMNAALQCIASIPHFQLFFETVSRIYNFDIDSLIYPLLCATYKLFRQLRLNASSDVQIKEFKAAISAYNSKFKGYDQQDSTEFFQCFLTSLNEEFLGFFDNCPRYITATIPTNQESSIVQLLNSGYFNNLFLGYSSTRVKCENCKKIEFNSFPMISLQLNIPQREIMQSIVKLYNFDNNGTKISHSLQVLYNSDLITHKANIDLAKLMLTCTYGTVLATEHNLGQNYKGLKIVDSERKIKDVFTGLNSDLHCFSIYGSCNYEHRGYAFINHGIKKNGRVVHFEYSLFIFPDANNRKLEDLYDHIIKTMRSESSVNLDFVKNYLQDIKKESTESNNLSSLETNVQEQSMLPNKPEGQNTDFSNLFSIYKLDGEYLDFDLDISMTQIQTESQLIKMFPLANGSNFLVVWNEEFFTKLSSNINYTYNRPNNNYLYFPISNQYNNFEPIPLTNFANFNLQFLDSVKDLANGKIVNNTNSEYQISLEGCIKDYLSPVNIQHSEAKDHNFECEYCFSNIGEKTDNIVQYPRYLIINFNRYKEDKNHNGSKNSQFVYCPLEHRFSENGKSVKYLLICVCDHSGSFNGGHYTSVCKNSVDNKWRIFNDSFVNVVNKSNVISSNTQMLIYQREESVISKKHLNLDELVYNSRQFFSN